MMFVVNGVEHRKRKRSPVNTTLDFHREKRQSSVKSKETLEQIGFREFMRRIEIVLLQYGLYGKSLTLGMILIQV
jgi:hypothetical protein